MAPLPSKEAHSLAPSFTLRRKSLFLNAFLRSMMFRRLATKSLIPLIFVSAMN
jgi:hypothetical protein